MTSNGFSAVLWLMSTTTTRVCMLCAVLLQTSPPAVQSFSFSARANDPAAHGQRAGPHDRNSGKHLTTIHSSADAVAVSSAADAAFSGERQQLEELSVGVASSSIARSEGKKFESFVDFLLETQQAICEQAESADGRARFCVDRWERDGPSEGFGITRVLEGGELLEKAACSVSVIHGVLTPERAQAMSSRGRASIDSQGGQAYSAAAMSLVFHSASPLVPTFRADVRYMEVAGEGWFGGGADLTPYYLDDDDVKTFHRFYKNICDGYDAQAYSRFKKWADDYFYIPMRKEHRGVGGIFFDDLDHLGGGAQGKDVEAFVREVALGFMPSFLPIVERRGRQPFTERQRQWQLMRRGRYLEFNLLYDRGVKFGLSGGRVESIMVSAPPMVSWTYKHVPEAGSEEERLVEILREPQDWVL